MLVSDLIKSSMRVAQVIRQNEDPVTQEMTDALQAMTIMLQSWAARKLLVRAMVLDVKVLSAGVSSYTLGAGGTIVTIKPVRVISGFIRDSSGNDTPLDIWTKEEYDTISAKTTSGLPYILAYDPGLPQQASQMGTIYIYPIPDGSSSYTLYMNSQKPFTEFSAVTETMTFEQIYNEAIKYELAKRLWREYHKTDIPQDVWVMAKEAMDIVEMINSTQVIADLDVPSGYSESYNIYTGGSN
jgi:hypothetical protein